MMKGRPDPIRNSISRQVRAIKKWAVPGATVSMYTGERVRISVIKGSRALVSGERGTRTVSVTCFRQEG